MTPKFRLDEKALEDFFQNPQEFIKARNSKPAPEQSSGTLPYDEDRLIERAREESLRADQGVYFG